MRAIYSLTWWVSFPLVLLRLWWRGRKEPGYRAHISERLGSYPKLKNEQPLIWIHAVSVGETRAAQPLIDALLDTCPQYSILLTHMTPTGRETGRELFAYASSRLIQAYLPYDTGLMTSRFLKYFSPHLGILMETEVWPNLLHHAEEQKLPIVLANARLSQRSFDKGMKYAGFIRKAAGHIHTVAAQTEADAVRLREFGASRVEVTGSVKFDVSPQMSDINLGNTFKQYFGARPVFLLASTRDGEEALLLDALHHLKIQDALILIVPRHPQRFDEVAKMLETRGIPTQRRSTLSAENPVKPETLCVLGDSMGEMFAYYQACDLAFIGGSILPLGGQNLLEPCAVGKPVLIGPHTFNFESITEDAIAAGSTIRVKNATDVMYAAHRLLMDTDLREEMGAHASAFAVQQRGATERTMALITPLIVCPTNHRRRTDT